MPLVAAGAALLVLLAAPPEGAPPGPPRGGLFISPPGKPFQGAEPLDAWWREADRNGDGVLDRSEMVADALAFFAVLDRNRDGVIDGPEVTHYEREIAPEILRGAGPAGPGMGAGGPPRGKGGPPGGEGGPPRRGADGAKAKAGGRPVGLEGAARFGLLNDPQPIMSADFDLNRRVTAEEYQRKARELFAELDRNRDGRLTREELPGPRPAGPRKR